MEICLPHPNLASSNFPGAAFGMSSSDLQIQKGTSSYLTLQVDTKQPDVAIERDVLCDGPIVRGWNEEGF